MYHGGIKSIIQVKLMLEDESFFHSVLCLDDVFSSMCPVIQDHDVSSVRTQMHNVNLRITHYSGFTLLKCCYNAYMQPQLPLFSLDFPVDIK